MKIGIDARMYGLEHAGIGRYVKNLVTELSRIDDSNEYVLFLQSKYYSSLKLPDNFSPILADVPHYTIQEQWRMWRITQQASCDVVHFPHFNVPMLYTGEFVVTIHDILWHEQKGSKATTLSPLIYLVKYQGYKQVVRHALLSAKQVIVPSNWVKQQLLDTFVSLAETKVRVVYEGVDTSLTIPKSKGKKTTTPYAVYVGSAYPHKNLFRLLQVIRQINQSGFKLQLKIVSSRNVFLDQVENEIDRLKLREQVELMGFLKDSQLARLVSNAEMLIQPSVSEGFGLTGLEAMKLGVPVVAAKAGAMPEIYQDAAIYFDPYSKEDMAQTIRALFADSSQKQAMGKKGRKQAEKYSWKHMADEMVKVYETFG